MTFSDSTPSFEELCQPSHAAELWKEQSGRIDEIWILCEQCGREHAGPPSPSQEQAAARALGAGWVIRRFPTEFPLAQTFNMSALIDGAHMFCRRCAAEFIDA